MKRFLPFLLLLLAAPAALAQTAYESADHVEAGVYGNFFRLNDARVNFAGLGGRAAFNVNPYLQFEAEMGYDFAQTFTERFSNATTVTLANSNIRLLDGLFGPKVQTNRGPFRIFFTAKAGFVDFMFDPRPASFGTFTSSVTSLRASNVNAVFYPGTGGEVFWGAFGMRLDAGDEIYFNNGGAHNNLRIAFGPMIRF